MIRLAALLLLPTALLAAPVPAHLMPQIRVELRQKAADHPLGRSYEIVLRNTGSADLPIWTDRPYGLAAFLDCEILNEKGERVSRFSPWGSPPSQGDPVLLRETIPAKKTHSLFLALFTSVPDAKLIPGKYRVRARFTYKDHDATSEWLTVEITEADIRTKSLVIGP